VIWSLLCITDILAAFIGKTDSNMVTARFWECTSMEHQCLFTSHLRYCLFRLVADIHVSDIGNHYWQQQWHAPCRILKNSVNGASTIFSFASWAIYIPIDCRHPFIRYRKPLLAKTRATYSLLHPDNERQWSVNSFSCCIFSIQGIARIFIFITELLTALIGKNTIYQR